jgi:hypothetical protein
MFYFCIFNKIIFFQNYLLSLSEIKEDSSSLLMTSTSYFYSILLTVLLDIVCEILTPLFSLFYEREKKKTNKKRILINLKKNIKA